LFVRLGKKYKKQFKKNIIFYAIFFGNIKSLPYLCNPNKEKSSFNKNSKHIELLNCRFSSVGRAADL
jgi:hypothetical protein